MKIWSLIKRKLIPGRIILSKAIKISLVVGSMLNLINQGMVIADMDLNQFNLIKFILNYLTPFIVSVYTGLALEKEKSQE